MVTFAPIHPGEILLEEFLKPLKISQNALSRDLDVPLQRINQIVLGKRSISVDTALRLAKYFGTTAELWLNLQSRYDLETARDSSLMKTIDQTVRVRLRFASA
jgi:addiction module HigA family antidote